MPYTWSHPLAEIPRLPAQSEAKSPPLRLDLVAYNSLTPQGFTWFIAITAILMCIPLMAFFGSVFYWGILAPLALVLCAVWLALKSSWRRGQVTEELLIWADHLHLRRMNPDGSLQEWEANPYWVDVQDHVDDGPVPHYVTLKGSGREVEIGAFLTEDERVDLVEDLRGVLRDLRSLP